MDFLLILLPIAFVLLLLNSQRKRTRQAAALQEQITVGTQICTTSGLFGTVVSLSDKDFVIEAAPGVHLRFDRRAIGLVVPSEPPAGPADDADNADLPDPHQSDGHDHPA
jgi:preprotein translocase subunit YajC